jgi:hypothetical protein
MGIDVSKAPKLEADIEYLGNESGSGLTLEIMFVCGLLAPNCERSMRFDCDIYRRDSYQVSRRVSCHESTGESLGEKRNS